MNFLENIIEKQYLKIQNNLVYFDSVTNCKTRFYYDNVMKTKYRKGEYCIVFVDIDKLKTINDTQGHYYGTQLIKHTALQLLKLKGIYDVCRIGGDEFVIVCKKDIDLLQLKKIENISYGYYMKEYFEDISSSVKKADKCMYKIKVTKNNIRTY